jgi:hypothetical protein
MMAGRPRYPKRRTDVLKGQVLGVSVRRAEAAKAVPMALTPTRRGLLEAVAADHKPPLVRWFPSSGWRCNGRAVNAEVRDCCKAGWATEALDGDRRTIALTDAGRAAIGVGP